MADDYAGPGVPTFGPPIRLTNERVDELITHYGGWVPGQDIVSALREIRAWRDIDFGAILTALQHGNPPGGWADPDRIAAFQQTLDKQATKIEWMLRSLQ